MDIGITLIIHLQFFPHIVLMAIIGAAHTTAREQLTAISLVPPQTNNTPLPDTMAIPSDS